MTDISKRIKEHMEDKGLSPAALSELTKIPLKTIYDWLETDAQPSAWNFLKVCKALKLSVDGFFGTKTTPTAEEREVLQKWLSLSEEEREVVLRLMSSLREMRNRRFTG